MNLLKWGSSSLRGHVVLFEFAFALPLYLLFMYENYSEGTLTVGWAVYLAVVGAVFGAAFGAFFWFTVSKPLISSRKGDKDRD
jgi:hypothetical protein